MQKVMEDEENSYFSDHVYFYVDALKTLFLVLFSHFFDLLQ